MKKRCFRVFPSSMLLAITVSTGAFADTSTGSGAKPRAEILLSFHTSIGSPPPEDYVIDVSADGRVEVTVYMTYRRRGGRDLESIDLKRKPRVKSRIVTAAELEPLRRLLGSTEVAKLKPEYKGSTWDVGSYSFTFPGADKKPRTVSTSMLAAGELPPMLQQLMGEARKLGGDLYRSP